MNKGKNKCPFCAEEVLQDAIKCKHCGELLGFDSDNATKKLKKVQKKSRRFKILYIVIGIVIFIGYVSYKIEESQQRVLDNLQYTVNDLNNLYN